MSLLALAIIFVLMLDDQIYLSWLQVLGVIAFCVLLDFVRGIRKVIADRIRKNNER